MKEFLENLSRYPRLLLGLILGIFLAFRVLNMDFESTITVGILTIILSNGGDYLLLLANKGSSDYKHPKSLGAMI